MADYSSAMQNAESAIKAKGMPMVFVQVKKSGEFDPSIQGYPVVETQIPIYGLKTVPTVEEVQGGVFAAGSMIVLLAGIYFESAPSTPDYLIFSGHKWDIRAFKVVAPAEEAILYKFQVVDTGGVV